MRAMESHVEEVMLMLSEDETLDIGVLIEYSGQGKCRQVGCYRDWSSSEQLWTWATSKNWQVTYNEDYFSFKRR